MRWEDLRADAEQPALLAAAELRPPDRQGSGRAGLGAPGAGPIEQGDAGEPIAVEITARSIINQVPAGSALPFRWTINPYRGCSHACRYCFARQTHTYLDLDAGRDFDTKILVKVNAGALLRRELAHPRWCREPIALGTNTDPYQRAEGRYRLMRQIITAMRDFANPFSVLTKGVLILRDIDLIAEAAREAPVSLAVSVGSVDENLWRTVEPGTPSPNRRLDVVRRFADRGIGCSVLMAPILPGLTDSPAQIDRTVAAIVRAGATTVTPIVLHLRPGAREWYAAWLSREHPHLIPQYRTLYASGPNTPNSYQRRISAQVQSALHRHGHPTTPNYRPSNFRTRTAHPPNHPPSQPEPTQLELL